MTCPGTRRCRCGDGANLRFVAHVRRGTRGRTCDRASSRSIWQARSYPLPEGRQSRGGAFIVVIPLAHRQILENAVFCLLEPGVIASSTALVRPRSITSSVRFAHGSASPVEIVYAHRVLGSGRGLFAPIELALRFFLHRIGHTGRFILSRSSSISSSGRRLHQLFLNRFELFAQEYSRWFFPTSDCTCDGSWSPAPTLRLP